MQGACDVTSYSSPADIQDGRPWQLVSVAAPFDCELELAVIDGGSVYKLAFPCRRTLAGWINAETSELLVQLLPTHWRVWQPA